MPLFQIADRLGDLARHEMPHAHIDASRVNTHQYIVISDRRLVDVLEFQDVG